MKKTPLEKLLWSIALPGFGQLLNKKYIKGFLFVILEVAINIESNLNTIIIYSFQGDIESAIRHTNYQWLMFYPCLYMFAIWDAYKDAGGGASPYSYIPFVLPTYLATAGIIYSTKVKLMGIIMGPVWLPMLMCFVGIAFGLLIKAFLTKERN
jgi:hypothetical protein